MPAKKYVVKLPDEERAQLVRLLSGGKGQVRKAVRAQILLLADEGRTQAAIAEVLPTTRGTVERICQRYCDHGLEDALNERPRCGGPRKITMKVEAHLVALACSDPPEGRACWTMQLLADQVVSLGLVESLSDEAVRLTLQKRGSSPGRRSSGASPA